MRNLRRTLAALLAAALMLCLCGCDPGAGPVAAAGGGQAEFDAFLKSLLPEIVDSSLFSTSFLFLNPEEAGLPEPGSEFGWVSAEDWEESALQAQELLGQLDAFDPAQLDTESQRTLALLRDVLTRDAELTGFYMLAANDLGVDSEVATLSTTVAHAPYRSAEDFDRLFEMYADLDGTFRKLVDLEQTRQEAGTGMTASEIELAVGEYERLLAGEPPAIQLLVAELIDGADFLTDAEKEEYKKRNADAVALHVVPAYQYLISALSQMSGRTGTPGLAGRMNGKEYYGTLLRAQGFDETPEELMRYLEEQVDVCLAEIESLVLEIEDFEALQAYLVDPDAAVYTDADTPLDILQYQQQAMLSEFPALEIGEADVVFTPEVLRTAETVAYYVLAPLDQDADAARSIYINDEETGADYPTLAHEGFPGHLYQDAYSAAQERSYVRRLLERNYTGATEGWGVYSSYIASDWTQDPDIARIAALSELTDRIVMAWADIGVNYLGWTSEELLEQLEDTFGVAFEDVDELTAVLASMPGIYVAYGAGGAKFVEMRSRAEAALGEAFDPVGYHQALLDVMPADFSTVEAAVDAYIASAPQLAAETAEAA